MKRILKMARLFGVLAILVNTIQVQAVLVKFKDDKGIVIEQLDVKAGETIADVKKRLRQRRVVNVGDLDFPVSQVVSDILDDEEPFPLGRPVRIIEGDEVEFERARDQSAAQGVRVSFKRISGKVVPLDVKAGEAMEDIKKRLKREGINVKEFIFGGQRYEEELPTLKENMTIHVIEQYVPKQPFPYKTVAGVGAAVAAAIGALYAGLKWYQKKRIRRVIAKHDLNLSDFSPTQKDAMAAAVLASRNIPGGMWRLGNIVKKGKMGFAAVSSETMWKILANLYYRKTPTREDIQKLKERIS